MSGIVLTAYDGAILGPVAKLLGWVMNGIYVGMYKLFGIENIGLSIILLTIVIYLCLLPLTIKQQKFSKLSQKMQPEIQAIQAKYKNKKDQDSMMAMNEETRLVYEKYGVSPSGSCVQLLIQMPILLALYRVFYNVPAYVTSVKDNFSGLVNGIISTDGFVDTMTQLVTDNKVTTASSIMASNVADRLGAASGDTLSNYIVDILYKLPSDAWTRLTEYFPNLGAEIADTLSHVEKFNYFIKLNISDTPWYIIKNGIANHSFLFVILAFLIPVLSYVTQVVNIKMMPQQSTGNDQMAQQMKTMNTMMPLMTLFIAFTCPVGLVLYWTMGSVVRIVQQYFLNKHFEKINLDDIIEKNKEKAEKKKEKRGIRQAQIYEAAKMNTKSNSMASKANISSDKVEALNKAEEARAHAASGSMASKANLVKDFNERNNK